ncbi:MAG TPA: hypothetical protein VK061_03395 [Bacillota bacterium]|nr:hypothetical protein [Bacillota bacterium]
MKKLLTILIVGTLVACNTSKNTENYNDQAKEVENAEILAEEPPKVSKDEVKQNAFFETELQTKEETKQVYVEKLSKEKEIDGKIYDSFIFYVADLENDDAFVQTNLEFYDISLEQPNEITFDTAKFQGDTTMFAIHPISSDKNEIFFWTLDDGSLMSITFEDEIYTSSAKSEEINVKILKDEFVQTLTYNEIENDTIVTFQTWVYDPEYKNFQIRDLLIIDEENETAEYFAEKWLSFEDYYIDFPYYTFTAKDVDTIKNGQLPDNDFPLGTSIEQVIENKTIFEEGYYDGGAYYETVDGMLFYNEETEIHTVAMYSGNRFINQYEIEDILGEPKSSGRSDIYPDELFSNYEWDDIMLRLIYNNDDELIRMELHANDHK